MGNIKNIEILADIISVDDIEWLESAADFYINHSHIILEVISVDKPDVNIKAEQQWNILEKYANVDTLTERVRGLFEKVLTGYNLSVEAVPFGELNLDIVTMEWIRHKMTVHNTTVNDLSNATGIPSSKFVKWINNEAMSKTVKSMFYYLLSK